MEWPEERLAQLGAVAFADDPALDPITLREVDELSLRDIESPHVTARRAMMPCIKPSRPSKVMSSGRVSGFPFLSNIAMHLPPYGENQALSLSSTAAPNEPPCMPPPANPVMFGDSGLPFGLNLVALACNNEFCACQPMVKW